MTAISLGLLDAKRREVFLKLKPLADKGGVLAGGTALHLQIKGRRSFDFDVFFNQPVVEDAFSFIGRFLDIKEKRFEQPGHITFLTQQGVQITLFYYQFPPLYPLVKTNSLPLFNIRDLAADKAYTLGRRPAWRDYVDLFFLLKNKHLTLDDIIKDAQKKFKSGFAPKLFLEQLTYYEDIKEFKIEFIGQKCPPQQIQKFLKKSVLEYTKKMVFNHA